MPIITKERLTALTETKLGHQTFTQVLNEARNETRTAATTTMFLSHSHDDLEKDYVKKAIVFLRSQGVRIYIDSEDASLHPFTNGSTAQRIKDEIKKNKKFVLLATNNAINSKWCNWELGVGDAAKYIDHLSLFPLAENSAGWNGSEYLQIYPRIEESNYTKQYFKVIFPNGTEVSIQD